MERCERAQPILYTGLWGDIGFDEVTPHIWWFDNYVQNANLQIRNEQDLNNDVGNEYHEVSPVKAVEVDAYVQSFLFEIPD